METAGIIIKNIISFVKPEKAKKKEPFPSVRFRFLLYYIVYLFCCIYWLYLSSSLFSLQRSSENIYIPDIPPTGKRIRFFRTKIGLTQKQLGEKLGFTGRTSDVRMAQYESEARSPKQDLINQLAQIFHVDSRALTVPDIDTYVGLMHTLFALEDMYGLKIKDIDGELCLCLDKSNTSFSSLFDMFSSWQQQAEKLEKGEISKDEYDEWRYRYPECSLWIRRILHHG